MLLLVCIIIVSAIIFIVSLFTRSKKTPAEILSSSEQNIYQYDSHTLFACPEELEFYRALTIAVKGREIIFVKVRAVDLLKPKKGLYSGGDLQRAYNKLLRKNVDFVLCDPMTLEVQTLIQLANDKHKTGIKEENYVKKAAKTAGIKVKRFSIEESYNYAEIEQKLYGEQVEIKSLYATR